MHFLWRGPTQSKRLGTNDQKFWRARLFQTYINIALRNLIKNRLYNAVNIGGLSVGLAACIMILLFVDHELSYDRWVPQHERIVRAEVITRFEGAPENDSESIPPVVGPLVAEQLSEIELSVRLSDTNVALSTGAAAFEQEVTLTDPAVFQMFGIELIEGNAATALEDPGSIVLGQADALRIFGPGSVVGKTLKVDGQHTMKVTGVMPEWPALSDLTVEALVPFSSPIIDDQPWLRENWGSFTGVTYFKLAAGVDREQFTVAFNDLAVRIAPDWAYKSKIERGLPPTFSFHFTPVVDAHLKSENDFGSRGSVEALWAAAIVAALILAIAVMNVTNLGTMLALKRVREVTIRKALGAKAKHLVAQILVEAIVLATIAMLAGLVMVELLLPVFGTMMDRPLSTAPLYQVSVVTFLAFFAVTIGSISGLYPALVAARFRPIDHLNGVSPTVGIRFRNFLMIAQFAATIGLLVTCFVVFQQANYAQSRDPGFNSDQLLQISGISRPAVLEKEQSFREQLARISGVEAVTASHVAPGHGYNNFDSGSVEGGPAVNIRRISVSEEFFETMNIQAIAGRMFSPDRTGDRIIRNDDGSTAPVIINRTALSQLGLDSPESAVGKVIQMSPGNQRTIVGVSNDLLLGSVRREVVPSFFWIGPQEFRHVILRVSPVNMAATLAEIDNAWKQQFPDIPIQREFLDEAFAAYYDTERRRGWLLLGSAVVMIVIATVGLFALSALTTERRAREIIIRKVLGARTVNIVNLLLWQFSKPILFANIIAWPIAWYVLHGWLEAFVDRIALSPLPFLAAGMLVMLISGATIVGQAVALALSNPARILRYE